MGKLQETIDILTRDNKTIAVAESLTAGNLQAMIASITGASDFFQGGVTVYSLQQKVAHLGVNKAHAASVNCVSQQVAEEMARGVATLFQTDIGMATTGYAEPDKNIPEPFAYYAIAEAGALVGDHDLDYVLTKKHEEWHDKSASKTTAESVDFSDHNDPPEK